MKKVLVILLALAFAAILLPGCPGGGGGGGGSEWISAGVARSVDRQFGPVTVVASDDGPTIAAGGGGSHEAEQLGGRVSAATVKMAVQYVMEQWLPLTSLPLPSTPVPQKSGLGSKLAALGSAVSVDSNPCEQDSDNDGVPDVNEDLCDPVTDEHCWGLCVDGISVDCRGSAGAFTIKFTDCQINNTTTWNWSTTSIITGVITTWNTTTTSSFTTTSHADTPWGGGNFCTDTTVNGTVAKILAWDDVNDIVNGVSHDSVWVTSTSGTTFTMCAFWNPTSNTTFGVPFTHQIQCARGGWSDTLPNTGNANVLQVYNYPYSPLFTGTYLGTPTINPIEIVVNGSITLAMGGGGVDEQLLHTRYNNLVQVWDTDGTGVLNNPYVVYNGQALEYRVLDANGTQALGTTWGGPNHGPAPIGNIYGRTIGLDRQEILSRRVEMDMDGENGILFEKGQYSSRLGFDNEDYWFLFTEDNNIVSWNDKNGSLEVQIAHHPDWTSPAKGFGGWRLVGRNATTGNPIYALSFYEKGNTENDKCSVPQNKTPCHLEVEVDPELRTFDVLSIANCELLVPANILHLTNVAF